MGTFLFFDPKKRNVPIFLLWERREPRFFTAVVGRLILNLNHDQLGFFVPEISKPIGYSAFMP